MANVPILSGRTITATRLHRWFRKEEPDVIVAPAAMWSEDAPQDGGRSPERRRAGAYRGYKPDASVALVDQEPARVGAAAVDLLVAMFYTGERGLPNNPLQIRSKGLGGTDRLCRAASVAERSRGACHFAPRRSRVLPSPRISRQK